MIQAGARALPAEEVREALARVMQRPALSPEQSPLAEALSGFIGWLDSLFGGGEGPGIESGLRALQVLVIVLAVVLAVVVLVRLAGEAARRAGSRGRLAAPASHRADARELERRAGEAEARGEWFQALRLHFLALLARLGGEGLLRVRDSWTNRELLERGAPPAHLRAELEPLVSELDLRGFGGRGATREDAERFASRCSAVTGEQR